jgi:hypothetical protein
MPRPICCLSSSVRSGSRNSVLLMNNERLAGRRLFELFGFGGVVSLLPFDGGGTSERVGVSLKVQANRRFVRLRWVSLWSSRVRCVTGNMIRMGNLEDKRQGDTASGEAKELPARHIPGSVCVPRNHLLVACCHGGRVCSCDVGMMLNSWRYCG